MARVRVVRRWIPGKFDVTPSSALRRGWKRLPPSWQRLGEPSRSWRMGVWALARQLAPTKPPPDVDVSACRAPSARPLVSG